jgi:outer membrane protein OmpA-like peptidoglycan-associated protein
MTKVVYTVAFASGSAALTSSAKAGIRKAVDQLAGRPTIILDAYADPQGDEARNLALTTARAIAVQQYITSLKYPPHKLLTRSRGERHFERANLNENVPLSRRVELVAMT